MHHQASQRRTDVDVDVGALAGDDVAQVLLVSDPQAGGSYKASPPRISRSRRYLSTKGEHRSDLQVAMCNTRVYGRGAASPTRQFRVTRSAVGLPALTVRS